MVQPQEDLPQIPVLAQLGSVASFALQLAIDLVMF